MKGGSRVWDAREAVRGRGGKKVGQTNLGLKIVGGNAPDPRG